MNNENFFILKFEEKRPVVRVAELVWRILTKIVEAQDDAKKAARVRYWGTPISCGGHRESRIRKVINKVISGALLSHNVSSIDQTEMIALRETVCCAFAEMARFQDDRVVANKLEAHSLHWNKQFHLYETWDDAAARRGMSKPGLLQLAPHYRRDRKAR